MCLRPIKIKNPTETISRLGGQPLYINVPCGKCAQCMKKKRLEWHFRCYQHAKSVTSKGGYIYFDTLTYNEDNIPHLSNYIDISNYDLVDFTCFDNTHWKNFLKNLRRQLDYHYNGCKFTYFLTSEYGTDPRYTHRPHYHVLFFIEDRTKITPVEFSELVSKCWNYGRTDGLPYQDTNYIMEHTYGYEDCDIATLLKVCNYVSKYVTKDSSFQSVIDKRKEIISKYINDDEKLKELFRSIDMFSRVSKGFGLGYLSSLTPIEKNAIYKHGIVTMSDVEKVRLTLKLPQYYERKLFYKCLKDADKKVYWHLNQQGIEYKMNRMIDSIHYLTQQYQTILANHTYALPLVNKILQNRTLEDFAIYNLFYNGRCRDLENTFHVAKLYCDLNLSDKEYNLYEQLQSIIDSSFHREHSLFDKYTRNRDKDYIEIITGFSDLFGLPHSITLDYTKFLKSITHNENTCFAFHGFDKLNSLFVDLTKDDNKQQQKTFDFLEELNKRYKILFEYV